MAMPMLDAINSLITKAADKRVDSTMLFNFLFNHYFANFTTFGDNDVETWSQRLKFDA